MTCCTTTDITFEKTVHQSVSSPLPSLPSPPLSSPLLTSELLLKHSDHCHSLVKDVEFSLRLIGLQVLHAHSAQLLKGLVQVSYSHPAPQWERHGTGRVSQTRKVRRDGFYV